MPATRSVLISGAGIAGPTLAYWLLHYGFTPTLVERAPRLRTDGYMIDFWGAGFEVANRMGLASDIRRAGYTVREVRVVDNAGNRISGFPAAAFTPAMGAFTSLPRGELAAIIYRSIAHDVETLFGDTIQRIDQTGDAVTVSFERHAPRRFDLVIGADGLHSRVRDLVFGPESRFERYLGIKVAAFEVRGYRPRDELVYVMHSQVGGQVDRFAMRDDRTMFLFTFSDTDPTVPLELQVQKQQIRARFHNRGWECTQILEALDKADDLYFDRVSQIQMEPAAGLWTRERVTLIGDAASCVSLLGGQGSALAMTAAYMLAGELHRAGGDHRQAFAEYQRRFAPFVARKQRAARRFAGTFAPRSRVSLSIRNQVFRLLSIPIVAKVIAGRGFTDKLDLPAYERASSRTTP
jgi:2-polyprenyl-6-methoxyphenol hydroxylase-like FAD-dependent oxidoreductase